MKRAIRRHHTKRIKALVGRRLRWIEITDYAAIGKWATTRTPCSCWMCGNPRYYFGHPIIGERRVNQRERY